MANRSLSDVIYPELETTGRLQLSGTSTDFHVWKHKLDFVLADKKLSYVLTEPMPEKETDPFTHQKFLEDDLAARSVILLRLHEKFYISRKERHTAKSLLDHITSFFTTPSMSMRMIMLRKYLGHKMSEEMHVNEHVLNMRVKAKELEMDGVKIPDDFQAVVLMNSLPDSWEDVVERMVVDIDSDDKALSLENVEKRVRAIGGWKEKESAEDDEARSMLESSSKSSRKGSFRGKCYGCGNFGHRQADCRGL